MSFPLSFFMQALPQRVQSLLVPTLQVIAALLMLSLLFINIWYIGGVFPKTLQWNTMVLVGLSFSAWGLRILDKDVQESQPLGIVLGLGFVVWVAIHAFYLSPVPTLAKREFFVMLQAFLLSYLGYSLWASSVFKRIFITGLIVLVLLELGVAFYQYYLNAYWLPEGLKLPVYSGRSSGTFGSPNNFAGLLSLVFFPALAAVFSNHLAKPIRLGSALFILLVTWGLVLAFSRGAFVGMALGLSVFPYLFFRQKSFLRSYALGLIVLSLCLAYLSFRHLSVFDRRLHFSLSEGVDQTRLAFWKAAFCLFLEHPILGQGGAAFNDLFEKYRPLGFFHEPIWVHNEYLNTLCDYGLLGFSLMLIPLMYSFRKIYLQLKVDPHWLNTGLFLSLLAYALHCFFDFNCRIPGLFFVASLAYAILLRSIEGSPVSNYSRQLSALWLAPFLSLVLVYTAWPLYSADKVCKAVKDALSLVDSQPQANTPSRDFYEGLQQDLQSALALSPKHDELWFCLAKVYYPLHKIDPKAGLSDKHIQALQKALEYRPIYWVYWVHYGLGLSLEGAFSKAQGALQTALNLAPYQWQAWYYYALCLKLEKTRPDKALEAIERCLYLNPESFLAQRLKAEIENAFSAISQPSV